MGKNQEKTKLIKEKGFSLIELLTALSILGIMMFFAVPHFREMLLAMDRGQSIRQIESDIREAQVLALSKGVRSIFTIDDSMNVYSLGLDYPPYSGVPKADEILSYFSLPSSVSLVVGPKSIIFDSRGNSISVNGDSTAVELQLSQEGKSFVVGEIAPNGFVSFKQRELSN